MNDIKEWTLGLALVALASSCRVSPSAGRDPPQQQLATPTRPAEPLPDRDGDKIADVDDRCCCLPEDRDGFQDEDGCPDRDNDGDGVLDAAVFVDGAWVNCDQARWIWNSEVRDCRDVPERYNGLGDDDGCDEPILLDGKQAIRFRFFLERRGGRLVLPEDAGPRVEAVARVMRQFPGCRYHVDAHSDGGVSEARALKQTEAFAAEMIERLVGLGVARELMIPRAHGLYSPVRRETKRGARAANRRLEILPFGFVEQAPICHYGTAREREACGCPDEPEPVCDEREMWKQAGRLSWL